ncbi:uncharacterized protein LOC117113400 [Anneissia japonica]|uniref:uncharacterized protein LOC117113400 n=1 Tax=Anneissia japonica TaxID=1529436 RepID=UPI00142560A9|nr:uncharacterized protein LOC117113400 [Anneissia japonica]
MTRGEDVAVPTFHTGGFRVFQELDLDGDVDRIVEMIERWGENGSGWIINHLEHLDIEIVRYNPLRGGTYVPLPNVLKNKKAIVNVKAKDDMCIKYAITSALHPVKSHTDRPSSYARHLDELDWSGIVFPTPVKQIKIIEKNNPRLKINVYGWAEEGGGYLHPVYVGGEHEGRTLINLLLYDNHYMWIKRMSALLAGYSKHKGKKHLCSRCMHVFSTEECLIKHEPDCKGVNDGITAVQVVDEKNKTLKFKNFQHKAKTPFVIYADFECILEKMSADAESGPKTDRSNKHVPCGWSYVVVRCDGQVVGHKLHSANAGNASTCVKSFLEQLVLEKEKIVDIFKQQPVKPHSVMTPEDEADFEAATTCWICKRGGFTEYSGADGCRKCIVVKANPDNNYKTCYECATKKNGQKVRDHCHVTNTYRGAAHAGCNLKLRVNEHTPIPVVFHNLAGYDAHLIMQVIGEMQGKIDCIPSNTEKYISFSLDNLRFIDSMKFLNASLTQLVSKLSIDECKLTKTFYGADDLELVTRKGVYPYEYMDSFDKFEEVGLPSKELFYSSLRDEGISDDDYEHAARVYEHFKCKNLGDYHDLYLKTDVLLLADVFQNFRSTAYQVYGLDPCNYFTLPGFSWDALLSKTGVELELITDLDMHMMLEKGIRGGISMVSHRRCKFNNKYMDDHDETKPSTYGLDLDANNLYGCGMSEPLPVSDFVWIDPDEYKMVLKTPADGKKGYFLEVDLEVPKELHDLFNDYPLAPEALTPRREWMSPYQLDLLGDENPGMEKLVPNLMPKIKYVVHHRNLQFYLAKGLKLTKVHRIIEFTQSRWMKEYIDMNTELRKRAKTDFEKDFFKLMNNSVFGKTMENVRNRQTVHLCKTQETGKINKLFAKPNFNRYVTFNDNLIAIHMNKTRVKLNKPIYCGTAVLDLSKLVMYEFYYDKLKPVYGDRAKLLYTDTDSLLLSITTEDVYADMQENLDWFDTSNYSKDSRLYSEKNKKVLGKMKDEMGGCIMTEFVGLRPKMYSIKTQDSRLDVKRAKGVAKYVVRDRINHDDYVRVLTSKEDMHCDMRSIRSSKHVLYTINQTKKSLSPLDTKRYILDDGTTTYAYGHYRLEQAPG